MTIKNLSITSLIKNKVLQSQRIRTYLDEIDFESYTPKELSLMMLMFKSLGPDKQPIRKFLPFVIDAPKDHIQFHPDRMRKRGTYGEYSYDRGSASTYEDVYKNQTLFFQYSSAKNIEQNAGRIRVMIDKFINKGIMKRLSKSTYLINPRYARNEKEGQATLMTSLRDKEF